MKIVVGITGASGSIYAFRLLKYLVKSKDVEKIFLVASHVGERVFQYEMGFPISNLGKYDRVKIFDVDDFFAPISSGSFKIDGMVVVPCSMSTLSSIASGVNLNLIHRSAEVSLKEGRKLLLVLREMPFNLIHVKNMEKIILSGGAILSASPSFYGKPSSIENLVDTVVIKILDFLKIENEIRGRWGGDEEG